MGENFTGCKGIGSEGYNGRVVLISIFYGNFIPQDDCKQYHNLE